VREAPGCDLTDPQCRIEELPYPHEDLPPIDGRDYEVYRLVTWADRDGAGPQDLKRFTTIVRWEVRGRIVEQRFDSERAPTPGELTEGNPSLQFLVTPSEVELDEDGYNKAAIDLSADFSLLGSMTSVEVEFEREWGASVVATGTDGRRDRWLPTAPAVPTRLARVVVPVASRRTYTSSCPLLSAGSSRPGRAASNHARVGVPMKR
jgi:hypothetical protein